MNGWLGGFYFIDFVLCQPPIDKPDSLWVGFKPSTLQHQPVKHQHFVSVVVWIRWLSPQEMGGEIG